MKMKQQTIKLTYNHKQLSAKEKFLIFKFNFKHKL